jgi:glycosyltransferase involved in cell wall biosynthesis
MPCLILSVGLVFKWAQDDLRKQIARSMRILFCNYEYPPLGGGGGVINALLAEEMAKRHEVTVLTSQGRELPSVNLENGVRVVRAPVFFRKQEAVASFLSMLSFLPMGVRAGKEILRKNKFDVINTHFVLPTGPVGDALSRYGGIPNVLSLHGGDLYDPSKWSSPHRHPALRGWIRRLVKRSERVVVQSSNTLGNLHRFYDPEIDGVQIPLAIGRPKIGAALRSDYGLRAEEILFVTVGRLVARKAIEQLIALMENLREKNTRLLILGEGPLASSLKQESAKRGLGDRVLFLGHVQEDEKFRILQMSDLYVSTSQHEGFGLVFLEAMASGLPIVCYDHGGQTDFLRDQETGYLVPLNNQILFRQNCELLIQNQEMRKSIGEANRIRVEEFYIDRCALKYENVFSEVVGPRTTRKPAGGFHSRIASSRWTAAT